MSKPVEDCRISDVPLWSKHCPINSLSKNRRNSEVSTPTNFEIAVEFVIPSSMVAN